MAVFELSGLANLRQLSLVRVHKLTDIAVFALAEYALGLEELNISYCDALSLDAIHLLLRKLEGLDHFTASGVPSLKREGLDRFSDIPPPVCSFGTVSYLFAHLSRHRNTTLIKKQPFASSATRMCKLSGCSSTRRSDEDARQSHRTSLSFPGRMIASICTRGFAVQVIKCFVFLG
jgi:hypothetical protein